MFDGYSIYQKTVPSRIQALIREENLPSKSGKTSEGSKYTDYKDTKFNTRIRVYSNGSCKLYGSFHIFKNEGKHNYDIFYLQNFKATLDRYENRYGIDLSKTKIQSLEFGMNVYLPFDPRDFIDSLIWADSRGKPIKNNLGLEIRFTEYIIKIYSKTEQSRLHHKDMFIPKDVDVLRVEIKFKKSGKLKEIIDVEYIKELEDLYVWQKLGSYLINNLFSKIILLDRKTIIASELGEEDKNILLDVYDNSHKSQRFKYSGTGNKEKKADAQRQYKKTIKDKATELSDKISTMRLDVQSRMERTLEDMIRIAETKKSQSPPLYSMESNHIVLQAEAEQQLIEESQYPHLDKGVSCDKEYTGRLCPISNVPIDNLGFEQKKTITAKGVEFYYHNHPEVFKRQLLPFLADRWKKFPKEEQFKRIAHVIRSKIYNPINNKKRRLEKRYDPNQLSLDFRDWGDYSKN